MAGVPWRFCGLFSKKEAVTVILWYAIFNFASNTMGLFFQDSKLNNTTIIIINTTMYSSIIVSYFFLGFSADAFIGRYRLIQFSLWVQLMAITMSTLITALVHEYHLQDWLLGLLYSILSAIEMLGHASFHVVAIQFGIDQLQGAPSDHLSAFVFWYYMAESIPGVIFQWFRISCLFSFININPISVHLGMSLFNAVFFSIVLSIKNCFMSNWFVRETATSLITINQTNRNHSYYSCNSNPYRLIFHVLKFAKEHKFPVQRSALTYWEDEIPSRIDLGKRKYGGPFTTEEVENVKTFLQLLKLLLSLSGVLVAFSSASNMDLMSESDGTLMQLIGVICYTAAVVLLIPCRATCYVHKCRLSLLKQIGIGAALTIAYLVSILLINSIEYATSMNVHTASYAILCILRNVLYHISYLVLNVSLIEFIIAQSPHTTKGLLIGVFYVIQFGVGGLLLLIQIFFCEYVHTSNMSCSKNLIFITIVIFFIAVLSFIMYCVVAYKYKLRERDEVVNVHIFAEEYYGNHKEDSYEDYSDMDD